MIPVKDSSYRKATDNAQGSNTDRRNQESGDSDNPEGCNPDTVKSGSMRHDGKGHGIWEWAARFQRRRKTDLPLDMKCLGGEDLALAEDETSSKTETISSDTLEATSRMKALRIPQDQLGAAGIKLVQTGLTLAENTPPSNADIIDELASIVLRLSDLVQLATTGPYNSRSSKKIAERLRDMGKCTEAEEFETLAARAKELRLASSDSS